MKKILSLLLFLSLCSCGGTWENDDVVWEKNFGEEKPKEINIRHSYYWKSSHWTFECISYMELDYNQKWLQKMNKDFELEADLNFTRNKISLDENAPKWFLPKSDEKYILLKSNRVQNLNIIIDKETNSLFFTYIQL